MKELFEHAHEIGEQLLFFKRDRKNKKSHSLKFTGFRNKNVFAITSLTVALPSIEVVSVHHYYEINVLLTYLLTNIVDNCRKRDGEKV